MKEGFFGKEWDKEWKRHWQGMPEFNQQDKSPAESILVHFKNKEDREAFSKIVGQKITKKTQGIWHPEAEIGHYFDKEYTGTGNKNPQFPLYIVSKGRAKDRYTSKSLEHCGVPYHIVIEEQEYDEYAAVIDPKKILVLDKQYQKDYNCFDDLGDSRSKGPGAARNFIWDHSVAAGYSWHWVMDDNIKGFYRLNENLTVPVGDGAIFKCMEDFCLRYDNIAMAGPNYFKFASRNSVMPPYVINTRIYSCNLIRNDMAFRWRGRYNEDTDLSLRMLKAGWNTVQFNAFLQDKQNTQAAKGGNTAEFYHAEGEKQKGDVYAAGGTLAKSQMQVDMHPDVSKLVQKFGRWHHQVDYTRFKKNPLRRKDGIEIPKGIDNYGMKLVKLNADER